MKKHAQILIVFFFCNILFSQEQWTAYTNTGAIHGIIRDGNYLWLAASGGLVHWNLDDSSCTKYTPFDGLAGLWLKTLVVDSTGVLWMGTDGSGVSRFDGSKWTTYTKADGLPSDRVFSMVVDSDNNKWFGTTKGLAKYDGENWTVYSEDDGLLGHDIRALVLDKSKILWVGTNVGISTFDGFDWNFVDSVSVRSMAVDQENNIWAGFYFGWVGIYDRQNWEYFQLGAEVDVREVWMVAVDHNNVKWFGSIKGLWRLDDSTLVHYTEDDGLVFYSVTSIYVDSLNNKWIGTPRGFSKFKNCTWTNYSFNEPGYNWIPALAIDKNNHLWASCYYTGVSEFDGYLWETYWMKNNWSSPKVNAIAIDNQNNKWFGTSCSRGLVKFDGTIWTGYTEPDGLVDDYIHSVAVDHDNNIWIGTIYGVSKFDGVNWKTYSTDDGLPDRDVKAIVADRSGNIWFAAGALTKFDGAEWTTYTTADGLVYNLINSMTVDSNNNLWIATLRGVSKFDGVNFTNFTVADGLGGGWVNDIAVDSSGVKWFCLEGRGISRFDDSTWTNYSTKDGLTDETFLSVVVDKDNNKWFGSFSGGIMKLSETSTGVELFSQKEEAVQQVFEAFPNPFNSSVVIRYHNPEEASVTLKIYNVLGQKICTPLKENTKPAGTHVFVWNCQNDFGQKVGSGVYVVRLKIGEECYSKKITVVK